MIDKLDVRIPELAVPGPILAGPLDELRRKPVRYFRRSMHYQYVCDLREPFDVDAFVHLSSRHGRKNHKIEIIDAGEKTLEAMVQIITQLFEVDPWTLKVMRTDLAVDMEGVPVPWFKDHAYVNRKQFSSRIEKSFEDELQFVSMGSAVAQTIYAGKRPNLFRIYDKLGEWRMQLRRIEKDYRRFNAGMEELEMTDEQRYFGRRVPPTFREYCKARGYEFKPGSILTRVERQIAGKIPPEFATVGELRYAHEKQPFNAFKIVPGTQDEGFGLPPEDVPIRNYLAAIGFETLKEQLGSLQSARQFVFKYANGNGKRILDSLTESRHAEAYRSPSNRFMIRTGPPRSNKFPASNRMVYTYPLRMNKRNELPEAALEFFRRQGHIGGTHRAANLTPEQRSEQARKAVQARWAKQATKASKKKGTK